MLNKLKGKRTYILSLCLGILAVMFRLDTLLHDLPETEVIETAWLTLEWYTTIGAVLGGGGLAALRAGVNKDK